MSESRRIGTMEMVVTADTKRAEESLERTSKSVDKFSSKVRSSTSVTDSARDAVSGLANKLGGLAAAYISVEGARKAFQLAKLGGQARDVQSAFERSGVSINQFRTATGGAISDLELMKKFNMAQSLGVSEEAFLSLAQVAQVSARETGQDIKFLFESAITGAARQSPQILDNLGISIKSTGDKAKFMADLIGKANEMIAASGDAALSASSKYDRLAASSTNAQVKIGIAFDKISEDVINAIPDDVFDGFGESVLNVGRTIAQGLDAGFNALTTFVVGTTAKAIEYIGKIKVAMGGFIQGLGNLPGMSGLRAQGARIRQGGFDQQENARLLMEDISNSSLFRTAFDYYVDKLTDADEKHGAIKGKIKSTAGAQGDVNKKLKDANASKQSFIKMLERELFLIEKTNAPRGARGRTEVSKEEFEHMLGRVEAERPYEIGRGDVGGDLAFERQLQGKVEVSADEFLGPSTEFGKQAATQRKQIQSALAQSVIGAFQSGDVVSTAKSLFVIGATEGASKLAEGLGPVGGAVAGVLIGAFEKGAQMIANAFQEVSKFASQQLETILSGSERGSKFAGALGKGSAAMAVGGSLAAVTFATPAALGATIPMGSMAGPAAMMAFSVELATMTDNFQRTSTAYDAAMQPAIDAMEPFGEQLVALAPIIELTSSALGGFAAQSMGFGGGMQAIFQAFKLGAMGILRMGQAGITVAMGFQALNIGAANLTVAFAGAFKGLNDMVEGITGKGFDELIGMDADKAFEDAVAQRDEAAVDAHQLGDMAKEMGDAAGLIAEMNFDTALLQGINMRTDAEREAAEATREHTREMQTSTRNIPSFFKAGAAAHGSADPEDGGGFRNLGNQTMIDTIIIVADGANDPEKMIARAEELMLTEAGSGSGLPVVSMANQFRR